CRAWVRLGGAVRPGADSLRDVRQSLRAGHDLPWEDWPVRPDPSRRRWMLPAVTAAVAVRSLPCVISLPKLWRRLGRRVLPEREPFCAGGGLRGVRDAA